MLIKCPECGREISDKANNCPSCGCPRSEWEMQRHPNVELKSTSSPVATPLPTIWDYTRLDHDFTGLSISEGGRPIALRCTQCFWETPVSSEDVEYQDGMCRAKRKGSCAKCGLSYEAGDVFYVESRFSAGSRDSNSPVADSDGNRCPKCGGRMVFQTVAEKEPAGCGTIILYILLALTVLGLLIVIPLVLKQRTATKTYAVCQQCGYRRLITTK